MGSVLAFAAVVLAFNEWAYGHTTSTGYSAGEITFSWSSLWPNLRGMPSRLATSMPMWILALAALAWIAANVVRHRHGVRRAVARRDATVAAVLGAGWLAVWFLYLNYTWTVNMVGGAQSGPGAGGGVVHVIRFYLPALGLIALLATWLLVRLPRVIGWLGVATLVLAAVLSFNSMASIAGAAGPGTGGPPVVGGAPGGPGSFAHPPSGYAPPGGSAPTGSAPGGSGTVPG